MVAALSSDTQDTRYIEDNPVSNGHSHVTGHDDFVWLERRIGQASTIDRHSYCRDCGAVRQLENHGRPVSFFIQGIANLVEDLEGRKAGKITQAEARLMMKAVSRACDLNNTYSTTLDFQHDLYVEILGIIRPWLDEDLLVHSLFRRSRKRI